MEQLLSELVDKLRKAHGAKLRSVVLYGSAAGPEGRDPRSDFNILCVLSAVTPVELQEAESVFRWWREMKNPAPLLLSVGELETSTDCFSMEFHDMKQQHAILFGENLISGLAIDDSFYRARVEHELRSRMIRLRQKAAGLLSEPDLLLRLMTDSVSTFCVLFRHSLQLGGEQPLFGKREVIAAAARRFGCQPQPFETLLSVREDKIKRKAIPSVTQLFREYLTEIETVVASVDRMAK